MIEVQAHGTPGSDGRIHSVGTYGLAVGQYDEVFTVSATFGTTIIAAGYLAVEDGRVVGFVSLSAYRDRAAYDATAELSMYVDAAYRRRGIARALLQALFA